MPRAQTKAPNVRVLFLCGYPPTDPRVSTGVLQVPDMREVGDEEDGSSSTYEDPRPFQVRAPSPVSFLLLIRCLHSDIPCKDPLCDATFTDAPNMRTQYKAAQ